MRVLRVNKDYFNAKNIEQVPKYKYYVIYYV
jgi:hypothetical protein